MFKRTKERKTVIICGRLQDKTTQRTIFVDKLGFEYIRRLVPNFSQETSRWGYYRLRDGYWVDITMGATFPSA